MGAVPGARALDRHRNTERTARLPEGDDVVAPLLAVEVRGEKPARLVLEERVDVALGNWGSAEAVPALIRALEDPEPLVRCTRRGGWGGSDGGGAGGAGLAQRSGG